MSKLSIQKVPSTEQRKLPIFDEIEEIADRIRVRAFKLFRERGFSAGRDLDDWLTAEREICWPAAELVEEDDEFEIKVALAGFDPDDILVTATPREIIIKASHKNEREGNDDDRGVRVHWSQLSSNDVYRRIELPADINVKKVEAEFENGMLEIEAPKAKTMKSRRKVRVKAASAKPARAATKQTKATAKKKKKTAARKRARKAD